MESLLVLIQLAEDSAKLKGKPSQTFQKVCRAHKQVFRRIRINPMGFSCPFFHLASAVVLRGGLLEVCRVWFIDGDAGRGIAHFTQV